MRLKQRWTPPKGTLSIIGEFGNELLFPTVTQRTETIGEETHHRTHFGFWCIHRETGEARMVEAPFYLTNSYRPRSPDWKNRWRIHGVHDGWLIFSLSKNQSYDIGYHVLAYDGHHWKQAVREERYVRLLTLGQDHTWRNIDAPGPLTGDYILEGGDIWTAKGPMRIAVDFTHAFSYDSGPDTPNSPEYLALQEETRGTTPSFEERLRQRDVLAAQFNTLIPEEYLKACHVMYWENASSDLNDPIWVRVRTFSPDEFIQLIQLAA